MSSGSSNTAGPGRCSLSRRNGAAAPSAVPRLYYVYAPLLNDAATAVTPGLTEVATILSTVYPPRISTKKQRITESIRQVQQLPTRRLGLNGLSKAGNDVLSSMDCVGAMRVPGGSLIFDR
jgi:hypothetical protein